MIGELDQNAGKLRQEMLWREIEQIRLLDALATQNQTSSGRGRHWTMRRLCWLSLLSLCISLSFCFALFNVGRAESVLDVDANQKTSGEIRVDKAEDPPNQLFLPLITLQSEVTAPPRSIFEPTYYEVLQRCAAMTVNQACLGHGAADGFTKVGEMISVSEGMTVALRSSTPTLADWNVVMVRLQAPLAGEITQTVAATQVLDLMLVGTVDLTLVNLIDASGVVSDLPQIRFTSQPLISGTARAPSGLIVINPNQEELYTVDLNGLPITVDATAFVMAQVKNEMVVNVRAGSAMVHAGEEPIAVVAGSQVKFPLATPGNAGLLSSPLDEAGEFVPLSGADKVTYDKLDSKLFDVFLRCQWLPPMKKTRQVYLAYYYLHQLNTPLMRSFMTEKHRERNALFIRDCARFEVIFDSTIKGSTSIAWRDQVHSEGAFIRFDVNGNLEAPVSKPLRHLNVSVSFPPVCTVSSITHDEGTFVVQNASLKLYYNELRVSMEAFPFTLGFTATLACHSIPPQLIHIDWNTMFIELHPDLWHPTPIYRLQPTHWKYTGRTIFAEAIFADRSKSIANGYIHGNSYFILCHAAIGSGSSN